MARERHILGWLVLVVLTAGADGARAPAEAERPRQPEDEILEPSRLRGELLRRGMTDLLQTYLEECPPMSEVEKLIYARQQKLAVYNDKSRDEDECLAALDEAIALLKQAIERFPDDPRAIDWQLQLGKDLIYKRAEPYYNNILFRGGSEEDRKQLLAIAKRATEEFEALGKKIDNWSTRLQQLSEPELRKLENSGEIERYRTLELQSGYFASWAKFYRALAARPGKERDKLTQEVITYLTIEKKEWIETDHKQSGVQCQALLLLGMTYRLAGQPDKATRFLRAAVERTSQIRDPGERRSLAWVIHLGKMEQIKLLRDSGKYDEALTAVKELTEELSDKPQSLSLLLCVALLEGSIYSTQAEAKAKSDPKAHARLMAKSREPLIELAARRPKAKDRIYAVVYPLLGKDPDPKTLGTFDRNVYIAGKLSDAARAQERVDQVRGNAQGDLRPEQQKKVEALQTQRRESLDKAITAAELLLKEGKDLSQAVRAEAMFNLAVCYFERGNALKSVRTFVDLVRQHPGFVRSFDAALYAVQLAAEMNRDPAGVDRPEVRALFLDALKALTETFGETDEAKYWQFYLANTLDLAGRLEQAAKAYAAVHAGHANYLDARYARIICLLRLLERAASSQEADAAKVRARAESLVKEAMACAELLRKGAGRADGDERRSELMRSSGDCLLIAARVRNEPPLEDHAAALDVLEDFDKTYGAYRDLLGRSMRLKIVALQGLGKLQEAKQLIPDYMKRDPENAGATIGALLASMQQEVRRARERNEEQAARRAAGEAVELAKSLYVWARQNPSQLETDELFGIRVQYAQACLEAQQYAQARELFQECLEEDAARSATNEPSHGPTLMGLAEGAYRIGQQAAEDGQIEQARKELTDASKRFLSVWRRTQRHTPLWWRALLRALEVPLALRELDVAQIETAARTRTLTPQEREQLGTALKALARIEQTIAAERMSDADLGGYVREFTRVLNRVTVLRGRIQRLGPS